MALTLKDNSLPYQFAEGVDGLYSLWRNAPSKIESKLSTNEPTVANLYSYDKSAYSSLSESVQKKPLDIVSEVLGENMLKQLQLLTGVHLDTRSGIITNIANLERLKEFISVENAVDMYGLILRNMRIPEADIAGNLTEMKQEFTLDKELGEQFVTELFISCVLARNQEVFELRSFRALQGFKELSNTYDSKPSVRDNEVLESVTQQLLDLKAQKEIAIRNMYEACADKYNPQMFDGMLARKKYNNENKNDKLFNRSNKLKSYIRYPKTSVTNTDILRWNEMNNSMYNSNGVILRA